MISIQLRQYKPSKLIMTLVAVLVFSAMLLLVTYLVIAIFGHQLHMYRPNTGFVIGVTLPEAILFLFSIPQTILIRQEEKSKREDIEKEICEYIKKIFHMKAPFKRGCQIIKTPSRTMFIEECGAFQKKIYGWTTAAGDGPMTILDPLVRYIYMEVIDGKYYITGPITIMWKIKLDK